MNGSFFYVVDEGPNRHYPTLAEAVEDATEGINIYREYCDPEWPTGVDEIYIYQCTTETEYPDEDGVLVMQAAETNVRQPEDGDTSVEYYCDYEMRPFLRQKDER